MFKYKPHCGNEGDMSWTELQSRSGPINSRRHVVTTRYRRRRDWQFQNRKSIDRLFLLGLGLIKTPFRMILAPQDHI